MKYLNRSSAFKSNYKRVIFAVIGNLRLLPTLKLSLQIHLRDIQNILYYKIINHK